MKKIINGKKYDTDTAQYIDENSNNLSKSDFRFFQEVLYKKKTGEFFLYGEGHGMSDYASTKNGVNSWGYKIIPLTENQTKLWLEKNSTVEIYEKLFGVITE